MIKYLLIPVALLFIGCEDEPTPVYDSFVKKYGSSSRFYCNEAGFLVEEHAWSSPDYVTSNLVVNDSDTPIRCNVKDISIRVKETAATGAMSGSVQ